MGDMASFVAACQILLRGLIWANEADTKRGLGHALMGWLMDVVINYVANFMCADAKAIPKQCGQMRGDRDVVQTR